VRGRSRRQRLTLGGLVALQVGLTFCLLVGVALFARSLRNLTSIDRGFDADRLAALIIDAASDTAADLRLVDRLRAVQERVRNTPGVAGVAIASAAPPFFGGTGYTEVRSEGGATVRMNVWSVSLEFADVMGMRTLQGDPMSVGLTRGVVIDSRAAELLFGREESLGRLIRWGRWLRRHHGHRRER
jgi:hypothetical protein